MGMAAGRTQELPYCLSVDQDVPERPGMVRENKIILHGEQPCFHKDARMTQPPQSVEEELLTECNHYGIILSLIDNLVNVRLLINMTLCCFQAAESYRSYCHEEPVNHA